MFVGFRLKSQPDVLWLNGDSIWSKHDITNAFSPTAFIPAFNPVLRLQPIIPTRISRYPIDVSAFVGDGEVWVGYGLRLETETHQESFDEMLSSQRFNLVWEIGEPGLSSTNNFATICVSITEVTEITVPFLTTQ